MLTKHQKEEAEKLENIGPIFQDAIHFYPIHPQSATRIYTFIALVERFWANLHYYVLFGFVLMRWWFLPIKGTLSRLQYRVLAIVVMSLPLKVVESKKYEPNRQNNG